MAATASALPAPRRGLPDALKALAGVGAVVVAWELCRALGVLPPTTAPAAADIGAALLSEVGTGELGPAILQTARTWALGIAVTVLLGLPLGLLIGTSRWADALLSTTFDFLRPVPSVAFVPVAVIFLGLGTRMEVFLIVLAGIWPIVYNVRLGIRSTDPLLLDTARTLRLGRWRTLRRVRLPALLPALLTGVRTSAAIAVVLTIVAELVASGRGIGAYIESVRQSGAPAQAWAGLLAAGAFGYAVALSVGWVERRAVAWHIASTAAPR